MNSEEIFYTVVEHLLRQGKPASNIEECFYRAPDGSKCAFGVLITNAEYDKRMEGCSVKDLLARWPCFERFTEHKELITSLQIAHDDVGNWKMSDIDEVSFNVPQLLKSLQEVALSYNIPIRPILETVK